MSGNTRAALAFAALLAAAPFASPAAAQSHAVDLVRQGMEQKGVYSGVEYNSSVLVGWDPATQQNWSGLEVSTGIAKGGGTWMLLAILRNTTSTPYCFRPQITFQSNGRETYRHPYNNNGLVLPGQHVSLLVATGPTSGSTNTVYALPFAFWPADMTQPDGQKCRHVAPPGIDAWEASGDRRAFTGSRR